MNSDLQLLYFFVDSLKLNRIVKVDLLLYKTWNTGKHRLFYNVDPFFPFDIASGTSWVECAVDPIQSIQSLGPCIDYDSYSLIIIDSCRRKLNKINNEKLMTLLYILGILKDNRSLLSIIGTRSYNDWEKKNVYTMD